jgi:hypothetical protein
MNKRLEQDDNANGIIIQGVPRGTHSEGPSGPTFSRRRFT